MHRLFAIFLAGILAACSSDAEVRSGDELDMSAADSSVDSASNRGDMPADLGPDVEDSGQDFSVITDAEIIDVTEQNDADAGPPRVYVAGELYECDCPNPDDACTPDLECVHSESRCMDGSDCPLGYLCVDGGWCANQAPAEQSPTCIVDEDCLFFYKCSSAGFCDEIEPCISSGLCSPGQICTETWGQAVCASPGPKAAGEACQTGYECDSGQCAGGSCRQGCATNSECPTDVVCDIWGFCEDEPRPDARAECGEGVSSVEGCSVSTCRTTADCDSNRCLSGTAAGLGFCSLSTPPIACKDNEFEVYYMQGADYCFLTQQCSDLSPCSPPYECRETGGGLSICGRLK